MNLMVHLCLLVLILAFCLVHATQIMQRPMDYATKKGPNIPFQQEKSQNHFQFTNESVTRTQGGRPSVGYFTNWGIYGRAFYPQNIDVSFLTHILYAFADVSPGTGEVELSDSWSDQEKHYDGDAWDEDGNNLYGNFNQLYLLKKNRRNLNVLLSIGGWSYSQAGHFEFVTEEDKRAAFVSSALHILEDNGLDGFDLDFEYPTAGAQAQGFSNLLAELRKALDDLATKKGDKVPYQISVAVPAGAEDYQKLPISDMSPSVSFWNIMAYDYAGPWSSVADHQANLYGPSFNNASTDSAVRWYIDNGASPDKVNIGLPLFGRGFDGTQGIGKPFEGGGSGSWEAGVYDYKVLPLAGATVAENSMLIASYSYDPSKNELITYDTPNIAGKKAQYILDNGLGGAMFWDLSGDRTGEDSLVRTMASVFGSLTNTENHLNYPNSQFDNIRNGMAENKTVSHPLLINSTTTTTGSPSNCSSNASPSQIYADPSMQLSSTSTPLHISASSSSSTLTGHIALPPGPSEPPSPLLPTLSKRGLFPSTSSDRFTQLLSGSSSHASSSSRPGLTIRAQPPEPSAPPAPSSATSISSSSTPPGSIVPPSRAPSPGPKTRLVSSFPTSSPSAVSSTLAPFPSSSSSSSSGTGSPLPAPSSSTPLPPPSSRELITNASSVSLQTPARPCKPLPATSSPPSAVRGASSVSSPPIIASPTSPSVNPAAAETPAVRMPMGKRLHPRCFYGSNAR